MQKIIISDTSCLILLEKIGELDLLHEVFGEILITQEIVDEYGLNLPEWISIQNSTNKNYQKILEASVDKGEASAIALAVELVDCLLIIDDLKGRNLAETLGIKITGTFGVILEAKLSANINSVKPLLAKIKQTDFHFSKELEKQILARADEK
jgi:predicted nucleic acid-binding protein